MSSISAGASFSLQAPGDSPLRSHSDTCLSKARLAGGGGCRRRDSGQSESTPLPVGSFSRGDLKDVQDSRRRVATARSLSRQRELYNTFKSVRARSTRLTLHHFRCGRGVQFAAAVCREEAAQISIAGTDATTRFRLLLSAPDTARDQDLVG